ncbi:MAG: RsbRD N-terminal domain-containing protein [Thermoanaerobaculales bacterium]|jgi:hypothetical protein|nr:RsbRD N-terminal domain-containing protein [Thermoanaerobaculales bacterium]
MTLMLSKNRRDELVSLWYDRIVGRYPAETERFLREQADPFANPVGCALREDLAPVVDGLLDGRDPVDLASGLDRVIRVRAVQDMRPSAAVGFVLELKEAFEAVAGEEPEAVRSAFCQRVERLLLAAFDVYSQCREQIFAIRVNEIRNRSLKVMERLNSWREARAGGPAVDA